MGKGAAVTVLYCTIHPYKYIRKKYPNMERGERLRNAVVFHNKMNKIIQKDAECIILIIYWYLIGLCSYLFFNSYINICIVLIMTI